MLTWAAMTRSVMHESSPFAYKTVGWPPAEGIWRWYTVLTILQRYEDTGEVQPQLPPDVQRPGAMLGLTLGLLARQAAIFAEDGWPQH
jgi:hypothetical protein